MEHKMPHHSLNRLIRKLESVTFLSEDERKTILELPVRVRDLRADQDIVREGDRPSDCCLLVEGILCRYKMLPNGTRTILAFLPGEIPDAHSLHIDVMDDSLGSVGPSKVALIAHDAMRQLIRQHTGIGDAFWRDTLIDAAIFREWIVNVGSREAYSRIAHLICEIFLKLNAVGLTNGTSFDFPITQSKIGEATGLSSVHVNRSVQALRADGLIVLERGRCTIPDLERLEEAAMFDPTYLHLRGGQQEAAQIDLSAGTARAACRDGAVSH
jgi:CRP-like cAMP-binding protein